MIHPFVHLSALGIGLNARVSRLWAALRKRIGLEDVRLHDSRHSFASVGVVNGAPLMVVGALLGRANHSTTQRYAHLANDPLAVASEEIGAVILEAMAGSAKA